jgi:hypothetical protein
VGGGFSYPTPFIWGFILLWDIITINDIFYHDLFKAHKGIFFYDNHPLDILRSLILFFIWVEKYRMHFNDEYFRLKILH